MRATTSPARRAATIDPSSVRNVAVPVISSTVIEPSPLRRSSVVVFGTATRSRALGERCTPMTIPLDPDDEAGPRTRRVTWSPSCDLSTVISWSRASSCACFSTTTSTSGRSQACTSIEPSKVSRVTLELPVTLKVWVSDAVAPSVFTLTVHAPSVAASAAAPSAPTVPAPDAITRPRLERRPID